MKIAAQPKPRGRQPDPLARAARKEQIILAAQLLFREKGFECASTAEISKAANISVAGLYQYFSSKDELIAALIERELSQATELLETMSKFEDFFESLDELLFEITRDEAFGLGSGLRMEIFAMTTRNETIAKLVANLLETLDDKGLTVIADAQSRGQVDPTLDTKHAAKILSNAIQGLFVQICLPTRMRSGSRLAIMDFLRRALASK